MLYGYMLCSALGTYLMLAGKRRVGSRAWRQDRRATAHRTDCLLYVRNPLALTYVLK